MTEYGIILLHKCKVEQTEVISRLFITFLLTNYKNIWSDRTSHFKFPNKFPCILHSYNIMSHVLKIYKAPNQIVFKNGCRNISPGKLPNHQTPHWKFPTQKSPTQKIPT